jgi:hypothetical protein
MEARGTKRKRERRPNSNGFPPVTRRKITTPALSRGEYVFIVADVT